MYLERPKGPGWPDRLGGTRWPWRACCPERQDRQADTPGEDMLDSHTTFKAANDAFFFSASSLAGDFSLFPPLLPRPHRLHVGQVALQDARHEFLGRKADDHNGHLILEAGVDVGQSMGSRPTNSMYIEGSKLKSNFKG